jgi:hypothetical protein
LIECNVSPADTAVVYLSRGRDGGRQAAEAFFESYRAHQAGRAHDLIVIAKGWDGIPGLNDVQRWASALSGKMIELPDDGYDLGAYFRLAPQLDDTWLCLLNTHSRIAGDDWLEKLRGAAERHGIGAAGATGSWGTLTPRWHGPGMTLPGLAAWPLRFTASIVRFPRFPNPHLRSNALILRRRLFISFAEAARPPSRKAQAHFLESGRGGLTKFLSRRGLRPVVVGADGRSFAPNDWIASGTFRVPGQPNLLIADNQTETYAAADRRMRRILEFAAWGETLTS